MTPLRLIEQTIAIVLIARIDRVAHATNWGRGSHPAVVSRGEFEMFKRVSASFRLWNIMGAERPLSIAALCLGLTSPAFAEQPERAVHNAAPAQEESVLIATREEFSDGSDNAPASAELPAVQEDVCVEEECNTLEPIAQSSDHTPDLATANEHHDKVSKQAEKASAKFDDVLSQAAEPKKKNVKHADLTSEKKTAAPVESAKTDDATAAEPHDLPETDSAISSGSARRAAAAQAQHITFEPVKFQGASVGKTTKHELLTSWGEPAESHKSDDGEVLTFKKAPFAAIEALVDAGDIVSCIKITLEAPLEAKPLADQLGLDKLEPLAVTDETEAVVCHAYPERGVLFMFGQHDSAATASDEAVATDKPAHVTQVVLQPIDARAFAYRAEHHLHGPYAQNTKDLKTAIAIDPEFARAYWLLAKIYIATGQADLADAAANEACGIEPKNAAYQLCHSEARKLLGEYDDAVLAVRAVLDREDLAQIDRAQALHAMAQLASLGDQEIASKTISFENRAIEIADQLATSKDVLERQAAKQLLVEAHVGIAEEVARQPYKEKVESLSQWIGRASGIAEEYIAQDHGSVELRLYIASHVLNGLANFKPTLDPSPWIAEAEEAAKSLLAQSDDELWQQHVKWELGNAYLHALRVEHTRRETEAALKYGQLAIDNLQVGASSRQAVHASEQLVGQLYFQMGAIYAVHKLDHTKAVQWYDKAAPLLTNKHPASELYTPRREGEMLVSMGVSYWSIGNQTKALDLTQTGVKLVETAVEGGVLDKTTLKVPYNNLSSMYEQMGENTNAAKYAQLAKGISNAEAKPPQVMQPRVGRNTVSQAHANMRSK